MLAEAERFISHNFQAICNSDVNTIHDLLQVTDHFDVPSASSCLSVSCIADHQLSVFNTRWSSVTTAICACHLAAAVPALRVWGGGHEKRGSRVPGQTHAYRSCQSTPQIAGVTSLRLSPHEDHSSHSCQVHHLRPGKEIQINTSLMYEVGSIIR